MWIENQLNKWVQMVVSTSTKCSWRQVPNGVQQGLRMVSVLFNLFISELDDGKDRAQPQQVCRWCKTKEWQTHVCAAIQREMEKLENWANRTRETSKSCTYVEITPGTSAGWGMIIWKAGWQRARTGKVILTMPSTTLVLSSVSQHKPWSNELMYWSRSKENIFLMVIFALDPALYLATQKPCTRRTALIDKWNKRGAGGIRNLCCIWVTM